MWVAGTQVIQEALPVMAGGIQGVDVADGVVFLERGDVLVKGHVGLSVDPQQPPRIAEPGVGRTVITLLALGGQQNLVVELNRAPS